MASQDHPTFGNGKICYLEIPADNIETSSSFYRDVFGWPVRTRGDGSVAFDDGVGEVSGTWVLGKKVAPYPGIIIHIMVDNAVKTLELIASHGGKIIQAIGADAPEITAKFKDPAGNIFGLYQHRSSKGN